MPNQNCYNPILLFLCAIFISLFLILPCWGEPPLPKVLTDEEQNWLRQHDGKIRLAPCPNWEPIEMFDKDGNYKGLVADYIHLIEKKLNFKFKLIRVDSWPKILEMAANRELDVIPAGIISPNRPYMDWTDPYYKSPNTIICRKDLKGNLTDPLHLLNSGRMVGFCNGYTSHEYYRGKYKGPNLVRVETLLEGLKMVAFGEIDAMLGEIPQTLYYIDMFNITNLRLAGLSTYYSECGIGTRSDWPILGSIMKKGLAMISETEREQIHTRWINLTPLKFYEFKYFWYVMFSLLLITFIILFVNKSLKREVARRTEELSLNETRLEVLLKLHHIEKMPIEKIMTYACEKAVQLTGSEFGYLAFAGKENYIFGKNSFENLGPVKDLHFHTSANFPIETMGLWRDAVHGKKSIIADNYFRTNPFKKGIPSKYLDINRYMNTPVVHGDRVVAVAGVGNKKTNYTKSDLRQLSLLMEGLWRVIRNKESEKLILNSEKQFRDLVENTLTGLSIISKGRLVYSNPEQKRLNNFFLPLKFDKFDHIHPDYRDKAKRFFKSVKDGRITLYEVDLAFFADKDQDQSEMQWVNCKACEIQYKGEKSILLNTIDITQTKQMERLLIVQEKMASLGHIAAGIAHEIRNPLAGIGIHLRNLEKKYVGDALCSVKIKKCFQLIHSDSARIESVIRRTLDFAKPATYKFEKVNVNTPVKRAIQLTAVTLRRQQVAIESDLEEKIPLCRAESQLMEDVIYNLIINASDAMKEMDGERKIMVASWAEKDKIMIRVDDTGPGVPANLRKKIFDPFFTTKNYSTGIGLGICSRIITDHGGTITVLTNEHGGARFIIKIPV